ncbi:2-oxoglutarate dehydrogenase E1 subunit family protein, partial [Microbispora sp. ATCC PTA-5024]|uniref:2-oxoglutarate dehydrogenase E1 subunit family protein n=1 Tax=Microbispora sp. ATCC PTA-5024 TaxID=316330 RepID=UPI000563575E
MSSESSRTNPLASFGQNEWLVDELYQKYLEDPESVDQAWWHFFADYNGAGKAAPKASTGANGATAVAAPAPAAPETAP